MSVMFYVMYFCLCMPVAYFSYVFCCVCLWCMSVIYVSFVSMLCIMLCDIGPDIRVACMSSYPVHDLAVPPPPPPHTHTLSKTIWGSSSVLDRIFRTGTSLLFHSLGFAIFLFSLQIRRLHRAKKHRLPARAVC